MEKVLRLFWFLRPWVSIVSSAVENWNENGLTLLQPNLWRKKHLYALLVIGAPILLSLFLIVQTVRFIGKEQAVVAEKTLDALWESEVCLAGASNIVFANKRPEERTLVSCSITGKHLLVNLNVYGCFKKVSKKEVAPVDPNECIKRLK